MSTPANHPAWVTSAGRPYKCDEHYSYYCRACRAALESDVRQVAMVLGLLGLYLHLAYAGELADESIAYVPDSTRERHGLDERFGRLWGVP